MAKKAENTGKKQLPDAMKEHQFKPGQSGNPDGRPKGARNRFSELFLKDFIAEWETGGAAALKKCRETDPGAFLRVAASILPKELSINEGESSLERILAQYSNEQLDQLITGLCTLGSAGQTEAGKDEKEPGKGSRRIH